MSEDVIKGQQVNQLTFFQSSNQKMTIWLLSSSIALIKATNSHDPLI